MLQQKRIFIIWWQGISVCPDICQKCIDSWKLKNPSWDVIVLDKSNIHEYIDDGVELVRILQFETVTTQTDLIRLYLLNRYGGLYTDATNMCNRPLDEWLQSSMLVNGIWMEWQVDDKMKWWSFPTYNFIYSDTTDNILGKLYNKMIDDKSLHPRGEYMRVPLRFGKLLPPRFHKLKNFQIGYNRHFKPKLGTKIISNDDELMDTPVDKQFEDTLLTAPFFKLTWRSNKAKAKGVYAETTEDVVTCKPISEFGSNSKLTRLINHVFNE